MKNQCDGCRLGLPIVNGIHINNKWKDYTSLYMVCTKDRYEDPKKEEQEAK